MLAPTGIFLSPYTAFYSGATERNGTTDCTGGGRGDYQKEGRDASVVSWQIHIFYIGHSQYGQLTAVKTR